MPFQISRNSPLRVILRLLMTSIWSALVLLHQGCGKKDQASGSGASATTEDPLYSFQWHLKNSGQLGGTSGEDINVEGVWQDGLKGNGVVVAVIDDGLEISHADLRDNIQVSMSYNYSNGSNNPSGTSAMHGTCVAGVIGARDDNGLGLKGVAPRSSLLGYNLIAEDNATDANVQDALSRNIAGISVSNNSWGYVDGTGHYFPAATSWRTSIETGLLLGRGGKGTLYIWAGGNGGNSGPDMSNYDGLTNFYGMMGICAVGDDGRVASYSEKGANLWVCAPSMGSSGRGVATTDLMGGDYGQNRNIHTSDLSDKNYTKKFNGTSAAAPIVSGVAALVLQANPDLTWRDVKLILAKSARRNDPESLDWVQNGAGIYVHDSYGLGTVDAGAAVALARNWTNVGPMIVKTVSSSISPGALSDGQSLAQTLTLNGSGISHIEYVQVTVTIDHQDWGELDILLRRSGSSSSVSQLAVHHDCYNPNTLAMENCEIQGTPANMWTFGSARHLDEAADGDWELVVSEKAGGTAGGTWSNWSLKIYGR